MKEILVNERVYEGLMRGEGNINPNQERQWWGIYPNRYKIMEGGIFVYEKTKENERIFEGTGGLT